MRRQFVALVVALTCAQVAGCVSAPTESLVLNDVDGGGGGTGVGGSGGNDAGGNGSADASVTEPGDARSDVIATQIDGVEVSGLIGQGLVLRTATGQLIEVGGDGSVAVAPPVPIGEGALSVVSQPSEPSQTCTAASDGHGTIMVSCTTNAFKLGGTATGVAGTGLVLESGGQQVAVGASGAFAFAASLTDLTTYDVRIVGQPGAPKQLCVLSNGAGRIGGADVTSLSVTCTTQRFKVGGNVAGLAGSGLVLALAGGQQQAIASDGAFTFAPLADGTAFSVTIAQQPHTPVQTCVVVQGSGTLSGKDVNDVVVVCKALGNLRISEVGSCYYVDTACWVEVVNIGNTTEQLSYHYLRTTARKLSALETSHTFPLPDLAVRPGEYVLVRAKSTYATPDGGGVVHVNDGQSVPWWSTNGFVELTSDAGTVDFVRFGNSTAKPISAYDAWTWETGINAPALPSGDFGRGIARDRHNTDDGSGMDWTLRAFATPGGPNDVSSDADLDADGVPDSSEVLGGTFAGIDVYAMGARTGQRDLFIEIDRMDSSDPAVIPRKEALDKLVTVFARRQIALHPDVGALYASGFNPALYNLGGGGVVPYAKGIGIGVSDPGYVDLYSLKAAHMGAARRSLFYYMLFGWSQKADGTRGSSGIGEVLGNDSIITLGGYGLSVGDTISRNVLINFQALTMMHELGHNLGLSHGGGDKFNGKPNYVSVMNYLYSFGLPTIGGNSEGDRYDLENYCTIKYLNQLTNPPTGDPANFVIDYSDGLSADLNESAVDESEGLGRVNSQGVDYNCNKKVDGSLYARDVNLDGRAVDLLVDHDDWSSLDFIFRRYRSGSDSGPYLLRADEDADADAPREDILTDDVQAIADQPCPTLTIP